MLEHAMQEYGIEVTPEMIKAGEHVYDLRDVMPADAPFDKEKELNQDSQYALTTLWDMLKFNAHLYVDAVDYLAAIQARLDDLFAFNEPAEFMPEEARLMCLMGAEGLQRDLIEMKLNVTSAANRRLIDALEVQNVLMDSRLLCLLSGVRSNIQYELELRYFLSLSAEEADYYEPSVPLLGDEVQDKCSDMQVDIEEAGKCLALGRSTACVFHLMRIMEKSVRLFGYKLGLTKEQTNHWHSTVEQASKVIKDLPQNDPFTERYAAIASHLYNVKVAWRNPVSHVRGTYTEEQAQDIFNHVKAFMRELVKVL